MPHDSEPKEKKVEKKKIESLSFVKQLFFGKLDVSKVFPFPRLPLEEKERIDLFCHKLRQFSEAHIDPTTIDRQSKIPPEVIEGLAKYGMFGLSIPQSYGGLGLSFTAYCKALEVLSQRCASTAAFLTAHQSIGYKAILLFGSPEQKQKWLPAIAKGEVIASFALTEPKAGSDAGGVETKAVYDPERNVFYLTGKKQWITNGSMAKVLTVMASTDIDASVSHHESITAFIVTPDMPGFKITEAAQEKVGIRGIASSSLEFDHMEVPAENMLGKLGEGLKIALSVLDYGRITIGASCVGPAKVLVDDAFKYAHDRYQFQKPLSSFPLVKYKLSMLAAFAYAIDAVTYLAAGKVDRGEKDFMLEAAIVKVFSTEALWWMIFETMQIFGGKAMFTDRPYERMMRDCRPSMIVEGSNDVMRLFISTKGIKEVSVHFNEFLESLKNPLSSKAKMREFYRYITELFWPTSIEISSSLLQKEAKTLEREVRRFGRGVMRLLWHYGDHASEKQLDLERIATAAICLYTSIAVLSKVDTEIERVHGKIELLGQDLEIGQFFCRYALNKARIHLQSLFEKQDNAAEALSDRIVEDL